LIFFVDESSFHLFPTLVKSYFRKGVPAYIKRFLRFKSLNMISGISPQGQLVYHIRNSRFLGVHMADFLRKLRKTYPWRKLIVIWDRSRLHYAEEVKELLKQLKPGLLELYMLPAHSPELNVDEQVWKFLKKETGLRNLACKTFKELKEKVIQYAEELKNNPNRILKMFQHPECGFYA